MSTSMFNVPINTEKCLTILGGKLLQAAEEGNNLQVETLLNKGASFTTDSVGTSALHLACRNGHSSTAEFLMRAGLSTNIRTKVDKTPLHLATQHGHLQVAQTLLNHGADVNATDMLLMTPLHWAVERNHFHLTKLLVENNADKQPENKFGKSPLDIATEKCGRKFVECLNQQEVGSDVEEESRHGQSKEALLVENLVNLENLRTSMKEDLMLPWLQTTSSSSVVDPMTSSSSSSVGVTSSSSKLSDASTTSSRMVRLTEAGKRILRCFNQTQTDDVNKMNQQRCYLTNGGTMTSQYDDEITSDDDEDELNGKRKHDADDDGAQHKRKRKLDDVTLTSSSSSDDDDDDVTLTNDMMTSSLTRDDMERWKEQLNLLQQQFTTAADDVTNA